MEFLDLRNRVTVKQQRLLADLHILTARGIPSESSYQRWAKLTRSEAANLIRAYYKELGVHGMYEGPVDGPEYDALSVNGKAFVDEGADPYFAR